MKEAADQKEAHNLEIQKRKQKNGSSDQVIKASLNKLTWHIKLSLL